MSAKPQEQVNTTNRSDLNVTEESNENNLLEDLQNRNQWVCWRYKDGSKVPINPHSGKYASSSDEDTWASYDTAKQYCDSPDTEVEGLSFVFSEDDLIAGVDLDNVRDPNTGEIEP
jgi:primase-polymerase (primpol)-like protein